MKLPKWSDFPTAAKVYLILLIPLGLIPLGYFIYHVKTEALRYTATAVAITPPNEVSVLIALPEVNERVAKGPLREHGTDIANAVESGTQAPLDYMTSLTPLEEEEEDEEEYRPYHEEWVSVHEPVRESGMRNVDWVGLISAINTAILSWAAFFYKRRSDRKREKRVACGFED